MFVVAFIVHWPFFLHTPLVEKHVRTGFFSKHLDTFFSTGFFSGAAFHGIMLCLVLGTMAVLLNQMLIEQRMFLKSNHLGGVTLLLFSGLLPMGIELNETLLTLLFVSLIFIRMTRLYNHPAPKTALFNIGLLLGISGTIQSVSLVYVLPVYIGISLARPFRAAEWVVLLLGLLTPFYFLWAIDYLSDGTVLTEKPSLFFHGLSFLNNPTTIVLFLLPFLFSIVGFLVINRHVNKLLIQARKNWSLLFLFGLTSVLTVFLSNAPLAELNYSIWPFLSIITSPFFYFLKPTWLNYGIQWLLLLVGWTVVLIPMYT